MFNGKKEKDSIDSAILKLLLKSENQMLVVISPDKKVIRANEGFKDFVHRLSGLNVEENENFINCLPEKKASFFSELIDKVLSSGVQTTFETQFDNTNDDEHYQVVIDPVNSKDKIVDSIIIYAFNISDLKNAKKRLYEERERLSVTLKSIGDGVIVTDLAGKIIYYNDSAAKITGYMDTESISKNLTDIFKIDDKEYGDLQGKRPEVSRLIRKDNSMTYIEYIQNDIVSNNSSIGKILVFKDVSHRIQMEEEIMKKSKLDSLSLLAGGLAHDYNNLLTAILGNITLCKIFTNDPNIKESLDQAEKAALKASDLTQKIITFSKGGEPLKKYFNLKEFLTESVNFYLTGSNVKCTFNISKIVGDFLGDRSQLSQAINNIIINSKQEMKEGGNLYLNADIVDKRTDERLKNFTGSYLVIEISDEGRGVTEESLPKIFDPYFTTKKNALGLGLSAAYSIIKRHNGMIFASNRKSGGLSIFIYLPASPKKETVSEPEKKDINLRILNVLIMDDEKVIRDTLSAMLKQLGCNVTISKEGLEAIELYKTSIIQNIPFDLVMLDLTIPGGMGGKQTIAKLLEIDKDVKAVVSSGYYDDPVISLWEDYGFRGVLKKPYSFEELKELINSFR